MTETSTDLLTLVEKTVEGMGFEFVDLEHLPRGLLRVTMDSPQGVGVDDCEQVSNQLTYLFTVENVDYERFLARCGAPVKAREGLGTLCRQARSCGAL